MSDAKEDSIDAQRELLIRYLDKCLEDGQEPEVEHLIERTPNASCELRELRALTAIMRDNKAVFCPDPMELADFLEAGHDPYGTIAKHLGSCSTCRREMDTLRASSPHKTMPLGLLERITAELPRHAALSPVTEPSRWFPPIPEGFTSLFQPRWMTVGAATLVLLLVFVMYPRDTTTPTIGVSSVSWNHFGNRLHGGVFSGPTARKPYLAIVLLFEDFKKPLPQKTIDNLYEALKPSQDDRDRYDVVPPSELTRILTKNKLQATDVPAILGALKTRWDRGDVALVTIRTAGDQFTVSGKLIDTATGSVVAEKTTDTASYSELKSKVRLATYSVLHGKR